MTGRSTTDEVNLAPSDVPERANYDHDFYSWSLEQARLVREGRWTAIDRENIAEEIESLGRTEFSKLESALRVLLTHMLKWDHQPERRTRSWTLSIEEHRLRLQDIIADNPGLKPRVGEAIDRAYRQARLAAARETGLTVETFTRECIYPWDDIVARRFAM